MSYSSENYKRIESFKKELNDFKNSSKSTSNKTTLSSQSASSLRIHAEIPLNASSDVTGESISSISNCSKQKETRQYSSSILPEFELFASSKSYETKELDCALHHSIFNDNAEEEDLGEESEEEGSEDLEGLDEETAEKRKGKKRPSDSFLRNFALQRPVISLFQKYKCPSTCLLGGNCKNSVTAVAIIEELNSFWGETFTECTTTYRRKAIISKLLSSYHRNNNQSYFGFSIGTTMGQNFRVCESTYLEVIGLSKTNMWLKTKAKVIQLLNTGEYDQLSSKSGFVDVVLNSIQQTKYVSEIKCRQMSEHCKQFIQRFGEVNGSKSPFPGEENLTVLPLETVAQLYMEYWLQCAKELNRKPASKETFRKTYWILKKKGLYKFTRGKGTFPTCDICNNANDLLANSKSNNMTASVRDLIMDLKTHHLKQQAGERCALEGKKRIALQEYDENGNPTLAVIFGDGMTSYAGRTPKYGRRTGKADGAASFENRVFGVEVYCGPVEGEILIHTDDLVRGGANFIIEVQRRVLIWLGIRLSTFGMFLPKDIHLQWDNCGENKNKTAFMFNSLLVEMGFFSTITVGFLIIGHTHASIDQYFSCLRGIIRRANFIASPLALQHLFSLEAPHTSPKKKKYRPPLDQIQLYYVHDYVSFFEPYRNKDIRGYGVPYQFRFYNVLGKAICQYKQFSDSPHWLPKQPIMRHSTLEDLFRDNLNIIEDHLSLNSKAGRDGFMQHLGLNSYGSTYDDKTFLMDSFVNNTNKILDKANVLNNAWPTLNNSVYSKGIREQEMRREDEEDGITHIDRYHAINDVSVPKTDIIGAQTTMEMINTKDSGYLIWINYLENPTPPLIGTLKPVPINPKEIWQDLLKTDGALEEIQNAQTNADTIVELQAELEKGLVTSTINNAATPKDNQFNLVDDSSSDSDCGDDYATKVLQKLRESKAVKSKLSLPKKKIPTSKASNDRRIVINAVATIKATAKYMLEKKIATNLVSYTGKTCKELGHSAFWNKIVSVEDLKYFSERTTVEDILNIVDTEIKKAPEFEWLPPRVLTAKQREERERRGKEQAEQFAQYGALYKSLLCRKNENDVKETVGRTTSDLLIKRQQKDMKDSNISKKKKKNNSTDDTTIKSKQVNKSTKSKEHLKLVKENEALEIEILQKKNAALKKELKKSKLKKKSVSSDDFNDSDSSSISAGKSVSTHSSTKKAASTPPLYCDEEFIIDDSKGDMMPLVDEKNYFEETTLLTTTASEGDIKFANKYISILQKVANEQKSVIVNHAKPISTSRGRNSNDKDTFLMSLKLAVNKDLNFTSYKAHFLPLLTIFGVQLPTMYTIDQLSKKDSVRQSFLSDMVDVSVALPSCSSSDRANITISSILKTILEMKRFESSYN